MRLCIATVLLTTAFAPSPALAQEGAATIGETLVSQPAVQAALAAARRNEPQVLEEQVRLCEIAAPPFGEEKRGLAMKAVFETLGLKGVRVDEVGNVLGERPGRAPHPHTVFAAHLDTVFPEGTDVRVRREDAVLRGPGIGDDCRGLAVLIGVIRALDEGKVETPGTITFVADVGEEGLGDLRGVKHLFAKTLAGGIDRFVSVDGIGHSFTHVGVGSSRYRVTFKGPGGHSYGAFGLANPIHALGRAIAAIADFEVPSEPKTTFSVGRIGGGTSVNSIAFEAWAEVDMRSHDKASLERVETLFSNAVEHALERENERWQGKGVLSVVKDKVGTRPPGQTPAGAAIVISTSSVTSALGLPVSSSPGSTDSNVPMGLGIPAVTISGGGGSAGTSAHSPDEAFDTTDSWRGTQRALLLAIALSQP
jgi:acetylornithine deacetylase/succinyl-diaminopimelate desuccinylase-like protein